MIAAAARGAAVAWLFAAAAHAAAVPEPAGYRLDQYNADVPATLAGARVIDTSALARAWSNGHPILIDVKPAPRRPPGASHAVWLPLPRRDIPGSTWLPDTGRGALSPEMERWYARSLADLTHGDRDAPLVIYCDAHCWMSWNAAKRAVALGYRNVAWYPAGADGWAAAGHPTVTATPRLP